MMPRRPDADDYYGAPARCPGCGAQIRTTLRADSATPVYLCNSTPDRIVCSVARWPHEVLHNVTPLSLAELAWINYAADQAERRGGWMDRDEIDGGHSDR
jgi:hypothetical protein